MAATAGHGGEEDDAVDLLMRIADDTGAAKVAAGDDAASASAKDCAQPSALKDNAAPASSSAREGQENETGQSADHGPVPELPRRARGRGRPRGSGRAARRLPRSVGEGGVIWPQLEFPGAVRYCVTPDEAERAAQSLVARAEEVARRADSVSAALLVLGFDTEWRVMFRKGEAPRPTALVQLCTEDECFLFQVSQHAVTPTLRTLLESPRVVKAGVGVFADVAKLRSDYGVEMQGVMNLAQLAAMKLGGEETWNLSSLTERVLRRSLAKDPRVRLGNWERVPLNVAQVQYACCDAYAGLLIFQKLRSWNEDEERLLYAEERRAIAMRQEEKESLAVPADGESGRGRGQGRGRGRERGRGQVQVRAGGPPLPAAQRIVPIEVRDGLFLIGDEYLTDVAVPAVARPVPLNPSRREAYRMWFEEQLALDEVAQLQHVKPATVLDYILMAIEGGHAYRWSRFAISDRVFDAVCRAVARLSRERGAAGVDWGLPLKDIKAALPSAVTFAEIRLCIAHAKRVLSPADTSRLAEEERHAVAPPPPPERPAPLSLQSADLQATRSDSA